MSAGAMAWANFTNDRRDVFSEAINIGFTLGYGAITARFELGIAEYDPSSLRTKSSNGG